MLVLENCFPFFSCLLFTYYVFRICKLLGAKSSFGIVQMITLKQTHSENGSVTRTRAQEIMVKSIPHSPTPLSVSSAERNKKEKRNQETFSDSGIMVTAAALLFFLRKRWWLFLSFNLCNTSNIILPFHLGTISLLCCDQKQSKM